LVTTYFIGLAGLVAPTVPSVLKKDVFNAQKVSLFSILESANMWQEA
jgi:hypothetical protein